MTSQAKEEEQYFNLKPAGDYSWTEPASDWDAKYPLNQVIQTESGHTFEMDDTPGAERVRLQHRTGTFTEIQSNGQQIYKIVADKYEIIAKNNNVLIKGVCNITVEGDSVLNIKGDAYTQVEKDCFQTVLGNSRISAKDVRIRSDGDVDIIAGSATGEISLTAAGGVNINGDLNVGGLIAAKQSITSAQNVTAGFKLFSTLGVETLGPIVSAISVFAPLNSGVIVTDARGSMELIRLLFNLHRHPRTSTPIPLM